MEPGRSPSNQPRVVGKCAACGYDLRGITSKHCPECGMPRRSNAVTIEDPRQYHQARAALEQRGLLTQFMDPSGTAQLISSGRHHAGWLWVDQTRLDEAEEVLDELGIPNSINSRPIVDRREPGCPECNGELDPEGPEDCPSCGLEFMWVEIDETATE